MAIPGIQSRPFWGGSPAAASQCLGARPAAQPAAHKPLVRSTQIVIRVYTAIAHKETILLSQPAHHPCLTMRDTDMVKAADLVNCDDVVLQQCVIDFTEYTLPQPDTTTLLGCL